MCIITERPALFPSCLCTRCGYLSRKMPGTVMISGRWYCKYHRTDGKTFCHTIPEEGNMREACSCEHPWEDHEPFIEGYEEQVGCINGWDMTNGCDCLIARPNYVKDASAL